ncbi:MAG: hypothetical protein R3Y62_08260 [Eubacteriales bacterium]
MSPLELADNLLQIFVLATVTGLAMWKGMGKPPKKELFHLAKATLCGFLGDLFWTVYFVIYGEFPYYFSSADLCFIGMYVCLVGLVILFYREYPHGAVIPKAVVCGVVGACFVLVVHVVSYWMVGGFWWTLAYALPLAALAYVAGRNGYLFREMDKKSWIYRFHLAVFGFLVANNMMFLFSSFGWNNLYIAFDVCMTVSFPAMLYCLMQEGRP